MNRDYRFKIISEAQEYGISATCKKYKISRTIYYRWLKRYQSLGLEGLDDVKKNFTPTNKTTDTIEKLIFKLIKNYPTYGPRAIKYLLDELGYSISESAVYNVMKRYNLSKRENRIQFAKKKLEQLSNQLPDLSSFNSGEFWIFWVNEYGTFNNVGTIYEFTIFDYKSKIACTRLYHKPTFENFTDLLNAVALPIAQSLHLEANYIGFFENSKLKNLGNKMLKAKIYSAFLEHGIDVHVNILKKEMEPIEILNLKSDYTSSCLSYLLPKIKAGDDFKSLKLSLQQHVRDYNISNHSSLLSQSVSPVEYHNKETGTKLILPLWAYLDRDY